MISIYKKTVLKTVLQVFVLLQTLSYLPIF